METIAHGGGLEYVMKTGFKPSARRARHGVQHVCTSRVIFYGLRYCAVLMQSHSDDSQPSTFCITHAHHTMLSILLVDNTTWILVRQEVHTLGIGTGNTRTSRTGPGPNIP